MMSIPIIRSKMASVLPVNSLRRRFARGAFWSVAATFMGQGLCLVASFVVARILGKAEFGELEMIHSTIGMFGVFAGLGLGLTATKHVAEFRSMEPARAGQIIGLLFIVASVSGGLASLIVLLAAPYLAEHVIDAPHLTLGIRIGAGLLLFNTLIGVQIGTLSGLELFKAIAKVSLFRGILNFPLVVLGSYFWGSTGAVTGMVCALAAAWLINRAVLRRKLFISNIPVSYRNIRSQLPVLWGFSIPAFLGGAVFSSVRWGANALLVNQIGGYAQLGIFSAATRFQLVLGGLGSRVGVAFLPILASREAVQDERLDRANILVSWLIGVIPALPLICFPEIMGLLFGSQYADPAALRTFVLVMCYVCIVMYKHGLARVLAANSLMWWGFLSNAVWAVVLLLSFWFLRQFGAIGLAGAFLIAYILNTACFIPFYNRRGLVPMGTMISLEAATVWITITGLALLSIFQFALSVRSLGLLLSVAPLYVAFHRLSRGQGTLELSKGCC